jgi:hypothetical protein
MAEEYRAGRLAACLRLILDRWAGGPFQLGETITGYWSRGHLASVPLPRAPGWDGRLRRLVELQLLAVVDRRFWTSPTAPTVLDVAPLALAHAIRRGTHLGRLPGEPSAAAAGYERARPFLGRVHLPEPAELALAGFIDGCLDAPRTDPPPAPGGSAAGPGQPGPGRPGPTRPGPTRPGATPATTLGTPEPAYPWSVS